MPSGHTLKQYTKGGSFVNIDLLNQNHAILITATRLFRLLIKLNSTTTTTTIHSLEQSNNKELIKSFIEEVFNKHNLEVIDKYHAAHLTNAPGKTAESFKRFLTTPHSSFPDLHVDYYYLLNVKYKKSPRNGTGKSAMGKLWTIVTIFTNRWLY